MQAPNVEARTSRLMRRVASTPLVAAMLNTLPMQRPCSEGSGSGRRAPCAARRSRSSARRSATGGSGGMVAIWPSEPMKVMTWQDVWWGSQHEARSRRETRR